MMNKQREFEVLKKILNTDSAEILESECPDFILKYGSIEYGVEITELYYDETSARLKDGEYIKELLEGRKYRHKNDRKKARVEEITYFSQQLNYKPIQMPILFNPRYGIADYVKSLKHTLEEKEKKLTHYNTERCMLIIDDRELQFRSITDENIAKILFSNGIAEIIRNSKYYEIYLLTSINGSERYIPLKAYLVNSDFIIFTEFVKENNLLERLQEKAVSPVLCFSESLLRQKKDVFADYVEDDSVIGHFVIYCERYGIGMILHEGDNWGPGIFDPYPLLHPDSVLPVVLDSDTDFFDDDLYEKYEHAIKSKIASCGLNFPVLH